MKILVTLCCFPLLFGSAIAAAGVAVLPEGARLADAERIDAGPRSLRLAGRVERALAEGRSGDAIVAVQAEPDPQVAESAAAVVIDRLRAGQRTDAASDWLQWIARQPVRLYRRHDETAADWFLPVFDLPTRAVGTLAIWQRQQQREHWQQRLATEPSRALSQLATADRDEVEAAGAAIGQLDGAAFDALRDRLATDPVLQRGMPAALWTALAERAPERSTLQRVLAHGDTRGRLRAIALAVEAMDAVDAVELLDQAVADPALASAATLALASLAPVHPPALDRLQARLDDPQLGPSAAAALARMPMDDRVKRIEAMLSGATGPATATHLVLALRIEGSTAARAVLRRWASDPALPESLRRELQR